MNRRRLGRARHALVAALSALAPAVAAAQDLLCDPGDVEVRAVRFEGNRGLSSGELSRAIATTPSAWARRALRLPLGARRCLDSLEFRRDVARLRILYTQRGYHKAEVDTIVNRATPGAVRVTFKIKEGPPVIIETVEVTGLDTIRGGAQLLRLLRPLRGAVFDRGRIQALQDSVLVRLRNMGYARVTRPLYSDSVDKARDRAKVTLDFLPGRVARIGEIGFQIEPNTGRLKPEISLQTVRRLLAFNGIKEGEVVRQNNILRSQRDLYQLEVYRHVEVAVSEGAELTERDSLLGIDVRLSESSMHVMRVGAGWGTIDCFRTQARYTDLNFFGRARRLALDTRLSKIGSTSSLLCPAVEDDPFSQRINYHAAVSFRSPALFWTRNVPTLSVYSDRQSEFQAYLRKTFLGLSADLTRELRPRTSASLLYRVESGLTEANEGVFCAVFNRCTIDDVEQAQTRNTLHAVSLTYLRDRTDNTLAPERGSTLRFEGRHVISTGRTQSVQFNRLFGEASYYRRVAGAIFAGRLQLGGVLAPWSLRGTTENTFVPPQERLYAGGPNSVRGYNQNQLGPIVYIVPRFDSTTTPSGTTVFEAQSGDGYRRFSPTGGNALVVGNLELRMPSPFLRDVVRWAAFVDFGQIWNRGSELVNLGELKVTPGWGLRLRTPFGPVRFDVGYNPNPLPSGPAYYVDRLPPTPGSPLVLLCVSPGNTLDRGMQTADAPCPATFAPPERRSFLARLTPHFSIGHAF